MDGTQPPTTPTGERPHGSPPRGLAGTPASPISSGRFGRMFRHLPVYSPKISSLEDLGRKMIQELEDGELDKPLGIEDDDENTAELDNGELRLPAGYTYFGQFVDHDITFDPVSSLTRQNDPDGLEDFRTPRFDLDSLYGRGPADQPYLYEKDGVHLQPGEKVSTGNERVEGPDLQRNANERALVGDPRNDENLIVSQLQATFLKFHNGVLDQVAERNSHLEKDDIFKLAQKEVRWHYQWVVVHDFLARLVGQEVVDDILRPEPYATPTGAEAATPVPRLRFYRWNEQPYMPVEFSVAAYRYGHSQVRPTYDLNRIVTDRPIFIPGEKVGELDDLRGFRPLPGAWTIDWSFFLDAPGAAKKPQLTRKIDAKLAAGLFDLPGLPQAESSLAFRNLKRGQALGLPSGQAVAKRMGLKPLSGKKLGAPEPTPLWFYILKESGIGGGQHLGAVGGQIVADVLLGLLKEDSHSFVNARPGWKPTLGPKVGKFSLADLVKFATS